MRLASMELLRVNIRQGEVTAPEEDLCRALRGVIEPAAGKKRLTIVCVGTPLNTGDALGPLVGSFLTSRLAGHGAVQIRGTLEEPVHARNLPALVTGFRSPSDLVLALDAAVGAAGEVILAQGPLQPGMGLGRWLPPFGDAHLLCAVSPHPAGFLSAHIGEVLKMAELVGQSLLRAYIAVRGEGAWQ